MSRHLVTLQQQSADRYNQIVWEQFDTHWIVEILNAVDKMTRYCGHPSPNWLRAMIIKLYKQMSEIRVHTEKNCLKILWPESHFGPTIQMWYNTKTQRSMSPTPVSPQTIIWLAYQACMMYLHAHNHCIKEYMTAKQYSTVLPVITKQQDSNSAFCPSNLKSESYPGAPLTGRKSCWMITLKWLTLNTSPC